MSDARWKGSQLRVRNPERGASRLAEEKERAAPDAAEGYRVIHFPHQASKESVAKYAHTGKIGQKTGGSETQRQERKTWILLA